MKKSYPACFYKENNGYSVVFPDLNYLSTCGNTIEEAKYMAVDCLAGYIYTCESDGDIIPPPSKISEISAESVANELEVDVTECFVDLVSVDLCVNN